MSTAESNVTGGEDENEMEQDQPASQSEDRAEGPAQEQTQRKKKIQNPCIYCAKSAASGSVQCTVCAMWCHNNCTGLSKETLKNLAQQAKEVGFAYWACRACLAFNQKWNSQMRDVTRRQEETDRNVTENRTNIGENKRSIEQIRREAEELRRELRAQAEKLQGVEDRVEATMADEFRERESRRLNLIIHGVKEAEERIKNPKERLEYDLDECSRLITAMKINKRINFRFCRRIGEKGSDPRPIVIGVYSEENRKDMLGGARELRFSKYEHVSIVPDLTKMQRRSEQRLREEADKRNEQLSHEDRDKNIKWLVVGRRGEKRLIKGTERDYSQRAPRRDGSGDRRSGRNEWRDGRRNGQGRDNESTDRETRRSGPSYRERDRRRSSQERYRGRRYSRERNYSRERDYRRERRDSRDNREGRYDRARSDSRERHSSRERRRSRDRRDNRLSTAVPQPLGTGQSSESQLIITAGNRDRPASTQAPNTRQSPHMRTLQARTTQAGWVSEQGRAAGVE